VVLEGLDIRTTNALGQKAIKADFNTYAGTYHQIRDVIISQSGSGEWIYGLYTDNFQSSEIYSLWVYASANTAVRMRNATNSTKLYGLEITGHPTNKPQFGIDVTGDGQAGDAQFFGGTVQGPFTEAAIRINGARTKFYGYHMENTEASPALGADIVISGSTINCYFYGMQGGSFLTVDGVAIVNCGIIGSEVDEVTLGNQTIGFSTISTRLISYTDGGRKNAKIATTTSGGSIFADVLRTGNASALTANSATPSVAADTMFTTANSSPTTITNFTGGLGGQDIFVRIADANTTVDFTGSFLKGNGGADWSPSSGDFMRCVKDSGAGFWYCTVTEI